MIINIIKTIKIDEYMGLLNKEFNEVELDISFMIELNENPIFIYVDNYLF
jgi:hypothetical protein